METGTYISGLGHVAVIGWAIIGGSLFNASTTTEFQVSDVSVISEAAFAALVSEAPNTASDVAALTAPETTTTPDIPAADDLPRLVPLNAPVEPAAAEEIPNFESVQENIRSNVQIEAPELADAPTTDSQGATLILPIAPLAERDQSGQEAPDRLAILAPEVPAPRVDSTPAPKPPTDAEKARETENATVPDASAEKQADATEEKAPDEAATEIITEAEKQETTSAPVRSSRPKGRPAKLAEKPAASSAIDQAIARDQAARSQSTQPASVPSGPPLTSGEREGLRLAVRECWNVNPTSEAARITVTVALSLQKSGLPISASIRQVAASEGSTSAQGSAFEAARRAILRCSGSGYKLPAEKYEQWRDVEITFNPEKMRRK